MKREVHPCGWRLLRLNDGVPANPGARPVRDVPMQTRDNRRLVPPNTVWTLERARGFQDSAGRLLLGVLANCD